MSVVSCWLDHDYFYSTMVCDDMLYVECVYIIGYYVSMSFWDNKTYAMRYFDLTIFESSISYTWVLSSHLDGTKVFALFLMVSCCDMFDLTIWVVDQYYWDNFQLLVENWWILWFIIWCLLVARRELLWLLWLSFGAFQLLVEN